ncbi:hypothetical protein A2Z67_00055 [Candidatus Woesebacteria bacterium RBG_13_36_22]|uniref:Uncharacterized protein n=1 Tax=Candidatus Woesebacteria bacterium RBG_13_36_22 TaxID=1802478 RepID=A0A1F7X6V4_9BACT|nr:MAG: hypothetical protein A2Z67_00055 [Candidatus Woesebacteria bacterium RBG_13_36_22]
MKKYRYVIGDAKLQYFDGTKWVDISDFLKHWKKHWNCECSMEPIRSLAEPKWPKPKKQRQGRLIELDV